MVPVVGDDDVTVLVGGDTVRVVELALQGTLAHPAVLRQHLALLGVHPHDVVLPVRDNDAPVRSSRNKGGTFQARLETVQLLAGLSQSVDGTLKKNICLICQAGLAMQHIDSKPLGEHFSIIRYRSFNVGAITMIKFSEN